MNDLIKLMEEHQESFIEIYAYGASTPIEFACNLLKFFNIEDSDSQKFKIDCGVLTLGTQIANGAVDKVF